MECPLRRTWAEIDLDALTHNFEVIRRQVGPDVKLLGVVKADAYGHGAVQVAHHLEQLGAAYLAVSSIDEAEELRAGGVTLPVLILGYTPADQAERILRFDVTQTVQDLESAAALSEAAQALGKKMKVHVKLDTGMGRLGFRCGEEDFDQSQREIIALMKLDGLDVEGVFTHFAVSDEDGENDISFTELQHQRFSGMIRAVEEQVKTPFRLRHCCNSGGIANYPRWAGDMVRCGIILYGTGELARRMGMKPVMSLKTTVSTIGCYPDGSPIGYGCTYRTEGERRIAVLPIGYADGLFRTLSNGYEVLTVYGKAPIVGRICMDMCMIDVTHLPLLEPGDEIEIYGRNNLCEDAAKRCGTISYELLCAVSRRVPRLYFRQGRQVERVMPLLG